MGAATMPSGAGWIRGLVVRGRGDFAAPSPTAEAFGLAAVLYALMVFTLVWLFRRCEVRWLAFLQPQAH